MKKSREIHKRPQITDKMIEKELTALRELLRYRLKEKGRGAFSSKHEILGIIEEELEEYREAVRKNHLRPLLVNELLDIAVGCIFGATCIAEEKTDW